MDSLSGTYILSEQEKLMVDALIGKGLCKLGIHKVDWTYRHSKRCIQDGVCQRCGAKRDRVYHDWVEGLFRVDCGRCGKH